MASAKKTLKPKRMTKLPLPVYHFQVEWGGASIDFSEVSGLNVYVDIVEYNDGTSPDRTPRKLPGRTHFSNVTLKRGVIKGDNELFTWMMNSSANKPERRDILIKLLDEDHQPVVVWKIRNAFPVRYASPVLIAGSSEAAIEELEIAHSGLIMENAG